MLGSWFQQENLRASDFSFAGGVTQVPGAREWPEVWEQARPVRWCHKRATTCPTEGFLQTGRAGQVSVNTELGLLPQELPQVLPCLAGLSRYTLEPLGPEHAAGPCVASFAFPYKREKPWDIPSARKHSLGADKYGMFAAAASKGNLQNRPCRNLWLFSCTHQTETQQHHVVLQCILHLAVTPFMEKNPPLHVCKDLLTSLLLCKHCRWQGSLVALQDMARLKGLSPVARGQWLAVPGVPHTFQDALGLTS